MELHTQISSPPTRRRRSPLLGCAGLLMVGLAAFILLGGVIRLVQGGHTAATLAVCACFLVFGALGLAAAFFGFSKKTAPGQPDFTEAKELREAFIAMADTGDSSVQQINAAAGLMLDGRYEESMRAYQAIAERFPDFRGEAYGQVGAACYFLGRYREAIDWYEKALAHGGDPRSLRDDIEEARAALR